MHRSLNDRIVTKRHYGGTYTTTQTPTNGVDLQDLASAEIVVDIGAITNVANSPQPSWAFSLEHSDTIDSGFEAVAETDVARGSGNNEALSSGVFATVDDAAEDDTVYRIGYVGGKRYVRVPSTAANTPGATPITVMVIGEPLLKPGTDS